MVVAMVITVGLIVTLVVAGKAALFIMTIINETTDNH